MRQFAAATHPGLRRNGNEDCYAADATLGLWLVADGVGGHASGEVAAAIVKNTVTRESSCGETLVDAIRHAHAEVIEEIARSEAPTRMGSTVVALSLVDDDYTIAWVGDSRAYLWDGANLLQLTRDHSHARDLLDRGMVSPEDVDRHPDRHALTQSIGVSSDMKLDIGEQRGNLSASQQILLCSDGLTDELTDTEIAQLLSRHSSPQAQVDALVEAALDAGGRDNVTVIVVGAAERETGESHPRSWMLPALAVILLGLGLLALLEL